MFPDIAELRRLRKKYNHALFQSGVPAFRQLEEVEGAIFADGALSGKTKELIGLGIAVATGCYGWIEYHVSSAADLGTTRAEIAEATAVGLAMGGAPAQWYARFAFKVLEELEREKSTAPAPPVK